MNVVPYTTKSGLKIGVRYDRPAPVYPISRDMERLQIGLLHDKPKRLAPLRRVSTWAWVTNVVLWILSMIMLGSVFIALLAI